MDEINEELFTIHKLGNKSFGKVAMKMILMTSTGGHEI